MGQSLTTRCFNISMVDADEYWKGPMSDPSYNLNFISTDSSSRISSSFSINPANPCLCASSQFRRDLTGSFHLNQRHGMGKKAKIVFSLNVLMGRSSSKKHVNLGKLVKLTSEMRLLLVRKIGACLLASHQTSGNGDQKQIRKASDRQTGQNASNDVALSLPL